MSRLPTPVAPVALLFLFLATPTRADSPAADGPAFLTIPNGVTDSEGKVGYLTNADVLGGIDAVNLDDGKTLWNTRAGTRPVALVGKKLVAEHLHGRDYTIVVLDTSDKGKLLLESKPLTLPDWVSLYNVWARWFSSEVWLDGGDAVVKWSARASYAGGLTLPPRLYDSYRKEASGYARVNLESGQVETLPADKGPPRPGPKLPKELEEVAKGGWVLGNRAVVTAVEPVGKDQQLVLKSWDLSTGKVIEPKALFRGRALDVETVAGGRAVLVRQAPQGEKLSADEGAWHLFSLETGKQLAQFPHEEGTGWLSVAGPRAYYAVYGSASGGKPAAPGNPYPAIDLTEIKTLKAVDLKTGKVIWDRVVETIRPLQAPY